MPTFVETGPTGLTGTMLWGPTGATGPTGPTGPELSHRGMHYLIDRCRIELLGASTALITTKLYDVFNEFFNDSSVWQEVLEGNFIGNTVRYYLVPQHHPAGVIIRLDGVYDLNGFSVPAAMPEPPFLHLAYPPNQPNPAYVRVVKTCEVPHPGHPPHVPYWVFDQYLPYLMAGLLSKMQLQPDRPYTDVKAAQVNHYKFREGVMNARVNALRKNVFGRNSWVYPQQFRTTSQQGGVSVGNAWNEF
jgi:hypothetical protein